MNPGFRDVLIIGLKIGIVIGGMLGVVAYLTLMERKVVAYIQERLGPNRVGPWGLFQPIADGIKLFFKEDVIPAHVDKLLYMIAPIIVMTMAVMPFVIIPFSKSFYLADINVGVLLLLAISGINTYGVLLAGISSNSKYSLIGGLRVASQLISYEVALALAFVGVVLWNGSMSLVKIVESQHIVWNIVPQIIGFVVFFIAALAELNRIPFDLPEAEAELVAGYHTEYSSMKFALFYLGEYANLTAMSAIITTLYLGGWQGPVLPGFLWFAIKTFVVLFVFMWIRWTYPRFRFDQLIGVGWKLLVPLALLNIAITAFLRIYF